MDHTTGYLLTLILITSYALPWMIAWVRGHHNATAIGALNLLLGWTVIGWIAALIWSLTEVHAHMPTTR